LKIVQHGRHQFSNAAVVASSALAFSAGEKLKGCSAKRDASNPRHFQMVEKVVKILLAILQVFAAFQLW